MATHYLPRPDQNYRRELRRPARVVMLRPPKWPIMSVTATPFCSMHLEKNKNLTRGLLETHQFLSPAHESGGGGYCYHHVWPSVFRRFPTISREPLAGLFSHCIHTSLRPLCFFLCFRWARALDLGRALPKKTMWFFCTARTLNCCRFSKKPI